MKTETTLSAWPAMTAHAKLMSRGLALAGILVVGATTVLLSRCPAVDGLSGPDIAQIRKRVRSEVWRRYTLPNWSLANVKDVSARFRRAFKTRIDSPTQWHNVSGKPTWTNNQFHFFPDNSGLVETSDGQLFLVQKVQGHWQVNGRG
jgi:hypothetical protein